MKSLDAAATLAGLAVLSLLAAPSASQASSEIFVCRDADGRKVYQNTGGGKGCSRLDVQPALSIAAPRQQPARSAPEMRAISPAAFPRVDAQTQRSRDGDRRRILEDELGAEEARLQALRLEFNGGQPERLPADRNEARYQEKVSRLHADLQRTENNIASLKRELALLTRQ